jgi:hypothetical protein
LGGGGQWEGPRAGGCCGHPRCAHADDTLTTIPKKDNLLSRLFKATFFSLLLTLGFDSKVSNTVLKELCCLIPFIFHKSKTKSLILLMFFKFTVSKRSI